MSESEESFSSRKKHIESSFIIYNGYSITSNTSSLQRIYKEAVKFNESFLMPPPILSSMIKDATLIASNSLPQLRFKITKGFRERGFRVDGLIKCLRKENIT